MSILSGAAAQPNLSTPGDGKVSAIVVAGGSSQRMGGVDKLWVDLGGRPILEHSLATIAALADLTDVVLVLGEVAHERVASLRHIWPWSRVTHLVTGGTSRQDSVYQGLQVLPPCATVLIHDGARPLVPLAVLQAGIMAARQWGAATAALPVADTIKEVVSGVITRTLDRRVLWAVQTPQVFAYELLCRAYAAAGDERHMATDDCALIERLGQAVHIFPGSPLSHKASTPFDLILLRLLLEAQEGDPLPQS